jgi:hypothetical protein
MPQPPIPQAPSSTSGGGTANRGNGRQRPVCLLYGVIGHIASRCYKRFNRDFLGIGNDGSNIERQVAMVTQRRNTSSTVDPAWYVDSSAMDHLTGNLDHLHMSEPYIGPNHVHTADGIGMRISHTSQSSISTSSTPLSLINVLCVPKVTRSL